MSGEESRVPLLVVSCDAYRDLWRPLFELFFRRWPDCPHPVYLGSNFEVYEDPRVHSLRIGSDLSWAANVVAMLDRLGSEHVLLFLEDFLLKEQVDSAKVSSLVRAAVAGRAGCVRLAPLPPPTPLPTRRVPGREDLGVVEPGSPYRVSAQAAIWKTATLRKVLIPGFSAWEFEHLGTLLSNDITDEFWGPFEPAIVYDHGVEKGRWKAEGIRICEEAGIAIDRSARGTFTAEELERHLGSESPAEALYRRRTAAVESFLARRRMEGVRKILPLILRHPFVPALAGILVAGLLGPNAIRFLGRWNLRSRVLLARIRHRRMARSAFPGRKPLRASAPVASQSPRTSTAGSSALAVSVILPVFNGEAHLREAVESILGQNFPNFELIVIDDGSTDGTASILREYSDDRIRVLRNDHNLGLTRSLNLALHEARSPLVARQDADDRSDPDRLRSQADFLARHEDVVLVGSRARSIDRRGRVRPAVDWIQCTTPLAIRWQLMFENPFIHSSAMFRTAVVRDLGGYDESFRTNQDFELWSRVARVHKVTNIARPLVDLRGVRGSASRGYSIDAIRRVGSVLLENRASALRAAARWDSSLDVLLRATNPGVFAPVREVGQFVEATDLLFLQFAGAHTEAFGDDEIRAHRATLYSRVAKAAAFGNPFVIRPALSRLRELDPVLFRAALVASLANSVRGRFSSTGGETHLSPPAGSAGVQSGPHFPGSLP